MATLPPQCRRYAPLFYGVASDKALVVLTVCFLVPIHCTVFISRLRQPSGVLPRFSRQQDDSKAVSEVTDQAQNLHVLEKAAKNAKQMRSKRLRFWIGSMLWILSVTCFVFDGMAIAGRQFCSGYDDWRDEIWAFPWIVFATAQLSCAIAGSFGVRALWKSYGQSCKELSPLKNKIEDSSETNSSLDRESTELDQLDDVTSAVVGLGIRAQGEPRRLRVRAVLPDIEEEEKPIEAPRGSRWANILEIMGEQQECNKDSEESEGRGGIDPRFWKNPLGVGCSKHYEWAMKTDTSSSPLATNDAHTPPRVDVDENDDILSIPKQPTLVRRHSIDWTKTKGKGRASDESVQTEPPRIQPTPAPGEHDLPERSSSAKKILSLVQVRAWTC
ncbi:hypothetical protein MMC28_009931 [Mycoblastus sanguinarius]|nr:hypothetical protein [Mycoblastus sanguinarius]